MKIAIDVSTLRGHARDRGIGRYVIDFVCSLKENLEDMDIVLVVNSIMGLPNPLMGIYERLLPIFSYLDIYYYSLPDNSSQTETYTAYNALLQSLKPDVFIIASPDDRSVPRPNISQLKKVHNVKFGAILFDLIPFIYPDQYISSSDAPVIRNTVSLYNELDFALCISEATKQDFERVFVGSTAVAYSINGAPSTHFDRLISQLLDQGNDRDSGVDDKLKFCYVGGSDYRKNVEGLINSLKLVKEKTSDFHCYIVYDIAPNDREKFTNKLKVANLDKQVTFTGKLTDDELIAMYQNCDFGIFPSLYEGLGLPILEHIKLGKPVLGSNSSSMRDIVNDERAMFDARNSEDIAEAILRFVDDANLRESVYQNQQQVLSRYNWDAVAELTYEAIQDVLQDAYYDKASYEQVFLDIRDERFVSEFLKSIPKCQLLSEANKVLLPYMQDSGQVYVVEYNEDIDVILGIKCLVVFVKDTADLTQLKEWIGHTSISTALLFETEESQKNWSKLSHKSAWFNTTVFNLEQHTVKDAVNHVIDSYRIYLANFDQKGLMFEREAAVNCAVIANNSNVKKQNKRLFLDWTRLSFIDEKSGIQRVTKGYTFEIIKQLRHNDSEYNVDVYLSRFNLQTQQWEFKYHIHDDWEVLSHVFAGDVFFLLDPIWGEAIQKMEESLHHFVMQGARVYSILHDILPVDHPEWFSAGVKDVFIEWLSKISRFANGIISVSYATQLSFENWLENYNEEHNTQIGRQLALKHIHNGVDLRKLSNNETSSLDNDISDKPYFLVVGTLEPRKGHITVLNAFEQLLEETEFDYNLVIVGKHGWNVDKLADRINSSPLINDSLFWLQGVDDATLNQLYQESEAVIVPSLAEGFGLPLIEAASYNKPVICSDIPVFQELMADSATYFKAGNSVSLYKVLEKYQSNQQNFTSSELNFNTWSDSASEVLKFFYNPPLTEFQ